MKIIPYREEYDEAIRKLISIPVSGDIEISLMREPLYITGAYVQTEKPNVYIALSVNRVVGVFNIGTRKVFYNDEITNVQYLCDLRIHPEYQESSLMLRMLRFASDKLQGIKSIPACTIVFSDNHKMMDMIERRKLKPKFTSVLYYHHITDIKTHIFKKPPESWNKSKLKVRKAVDSDIRSLMQLQASVEKGNYQSYIEYDNLNSNSHYHGINISNFYLALQNEEIVGCIGYWDTREFKQTVVNSYSALYTLFRPFYNTIAARIFQFPPLPDPGEKLNTISIHSIIIKNRRPEIFKKLLYHISKDIDSTLMCSIDSRDPLSKVFNTLFSKFSKDGKFYLVNYGEDLNDNYKEGYINIDAARI